MKKRSMKRKSDKKGRQSAADPKCASGLFYLYEPEFPTSIFVVYHGTRGRFHYFVCLQFILRKQIAALIRLWDLPAEFEVRFHRDWKEFVFNQVIDPLQRRVDPASEYAA